MDRTILHCDCNSFFASVELLTLPDLREKPVAVCGNPENRHGIILAKNEAAKRFGVQTAETIGQAKKKCPELILIPPHHDRYAKYSMLLNAIYERFTDQVEPFGIDESWLDVTGSLHLFGDGKTIADTIRKTVKEELGLTVSVGVSFNKVFAKLGSDYKKPDATTVISSENFRSLLYPLPIGDLLYVGRASAEALKKYGVQTIGQLAAFDRKALSELLGKSGEMLYDYACGLDDSPVARAGEKREVKSVGNGMTFKRDISGIQDIKKAVTALSDSVAGRLREDGLACRTVQVIIKNPQLKSISRQRGLKRPTNLAKEIAAEAMEIIKASWNIHAPIRMLTITGMNLVNEDAGSMAQLSLFEDGTGETAHIRQQKLEKAIDKIRSRYGRDAISAGSLIQNDIGIETRGREGDED
jgi:DNA polymerase-4